MLDSPLPFIIAGVLLAIGAGIAIWRRRSDRTRTGLLTLGLALGLAVVALGYVAVNPFSDSAPPLAEEFTSPPAAAQPENTAEPGDGESRSVETGHDEPQPESGQPDPPPPAPQTLDAADPDADATRLVVGTWTDNYQGKRTMTLNEDGTGTMIVELSGMKARLFASELLFEMEWSVENGRLKKRTLRGEPAGRVALILKTMGDRVDEPILELTERQLVLLDKDGQTRYTWTRVVDAEVAQESDE